MSIIHGYNDYTPWVMVMGIIIPRIMPTKMWVRIITAKYVILLKYLGQCLVYKHLLNKTNLTVLGI